MWFMASCELKCITSSCCITVKYRRDGLRVVFVSVCVGSSRFPLHPSPWQRRTNQSPPCLFSFHHTRPTSGFISRPAFMKTHGGRIISWGDGLTEESSVPMRPEASVYCVCVFMRVFTGGEVIYLQLYRAVVIKTFYIFSVECNYEEFQEIKPIYARFNPLNSCTYICILAYCEVISNAL